MKNNLEELLKRYNLEKVESLSDLVYCCKCNNYSIPNLVKDWMKYDNRKEALNYCIQKYIKGEYRK